MDFEGKIATSNDLQTAKLDVYFEEAGNKKYVPRSIQVDLEPAVLDTVRAGRLGHLYRPDTFIHVSLGAADLPCEVLPSPHASTCVLFS